MYKLLTYLLFFGATLLSFGQYNRYTIFPSLQPQHLLDENKTDISCALALRLIDSEYEGPLVRLRRDSDNSEMDFYANAKDRIDTEAISDWANNSALYVVNWYDQSGKTQHAFQPDPSKQPSFINDSTQPYWVGDATDDFLYIDNSILSLTNNGKNGSVFCVAYATTRSQTSFGAANNHVRWLTHINWRDNNVYFDPGSCCQTGRSYSNNANNGKLGAWGQYSFIRRDDPNDASTDRRILKRDGTTIVDQGYDDALACTIDYNLGIGACVISNSNNISNPSDTRFAEFIMYAEGKEDTTIQEIEANQIAFWLP